VPAAVRGRERHLVRPLPMHRAFAELSLAVDHGASEVVAARALPLLAGGDGGRSRELAGGVMRV
jgi:hypothetical protein